MKVDIWIYTDDGGEIHREGLSWSEACTEIVSEYIMEQLSNHLSSEQMKDFIHDIIIEKGQTNESNKN